NEIENRALAFSNSSGSSGRSNSKRPIDRDIMNKVKDVLGEQQVLYDENSDLEIVLHKPPVGHSMFEGWMEMNELYPAARELTYVEFPTKYVWNAPKRIWTLRKQRKSIGRIHNVPISTRDALYCRMLLNTGLLEDDKEYIKCIKDVAHWATVEHLRELFVILLSQKELTMPLSVWLQTWHLLAGDVQFKLRRILKRPEWILKVRYGELGEANDEEVSIDVLEELLIDAVDDPVTSIIDFTYPSVLNNINNTSYFQENAIFAPTNEVVDTINDHLLNKFPGEEMAYLSCDCIDKTERGSTIDEAVLSPEFINGLKF
nr:NADH-ubiquinone oxidoreductase chain 2 [Tanacetum cinerariifolium]